MLQPSFDDLRIWARTARSGARVKYAEGANASDLAEESFRMVEALTALGLAVPSLARRCGRLVYLATRTAAPCPDDDRLLAAFAAAVDAADARASE